MKQRQKVNYEPVERICELKGCDKPIIQGIDESNQHFAARTHCSGGCGYKAAHKKRVAKKGARPENKKCQVCGKHFGRVTYSSGRIEPYNKYLKKKVCSYDCTRELIKRTNLEKTGDLVKLARLRFTSKVQQWFSPGLAK